MTERKRLEIPQSTLDQELASEAFHNSFGEYEKVIKELGIVQTILVGDKLGLRTSYVWNVLSQDFSPEGMGGSMFAQLDEGATRVIKETHDYQPVRIANVLPSRLAQLSRLYEEAGFTLELFQIANQGVETTSTPHHIEAEDSGLDVLIGVESYHQRLQQAQEIARQARIVWGEGFEETFRLDIFDEMRDRAAGVMLKDITLARNAVIEGGFARGLELLAEPWRVLSEITGDPYNPHLDIITVLDVTGAIEAGVLKLY
ncbi:hypothetical protein HYZ05_02555 [Candidatus Daviesbacteria bacterium]|nr:hypothetical protein [Candidatus Daviesbacteria bacterium]